MIENIFNLKQRKTNKLSDQLLASGLLLSEQGHDEKAIEKYLEALALDPERSECYYNIRLIFKYRNEWQKSFEYNQKAYALSPKGQAARWNYAIAATALRDWVTARNLWKDEGIELDNADGPVICDFGITPVRLNSDGNAEVVWAKRIDPVRAEIVSVPFDSSNYCAGDTVLHDGAAVGYRMLGDQEMPVFNVLELFEKSVLSTFKAIITVAGQSDIDLLEKLFIESNMIFEDWTTNYRVLCKACSEGRPHDYHDEEAEQAWLPEHELGIAAMSQGDIDKIFTQWVNGSSRMLKTFCCVYSRQ